MSSPWLVNLSTRAWSFGLRELADPAIDVRLHRPSLSREVEERALSRLRVTGSRRDLVLREPHAAGGRLGAPCGGGLKRKPLQRHPLAQRNAGRRLLRLAPRAGDAPEKSDE